jgi:16S rRNA (cytosine967-C5)-methyltransferase
MKPAARIQAAIEIYGEIVAKRAAADRTVAGWMRGHRFAGSGDRRAITALVYDALRRRGELAWRLGRDDSRLIVLAALGETAERLALLCDGSQYAPAPLSDGEWKALAAPEPSDMPDWARVNCPEWLWPHFTARFGDDAVAEVAALGGRAPLDLRVNTLKASRDDVLAAFAAAGVTATPAPHAPHGVRLTEHARLDKHPLFLDGKVEPQDEAAQLCAILVDAKPGMTVVDACAGAGGKTLALAAAMNDTGALHALDRDAKRLKRLEARAERAGVTIVHTNTFGAGLDAMAGKADRVLVDVLCSGTGTWRRNPEARWHLTPAMLAEHAQAQRAILAHAALAVAPGGRLVYATCSLLPAEDEDVVKDFLSAQPDFAAVDCAAPPLPAGLAQGGNLLLTPHRHNTDGFFTAVLQRAAYARGKILFHGEPAHAQDPCFDRRSCHWHAGCRLWHGRFRAAAA